MLGITLTLLLGALLPSPARAVIQSRQLPAQLQPQAQLQPPQVQGGAAAIQPQARQPTPQAQSWAQPSFAQSQGGDLTVPAEGGLSENPGTTVKVFGVPVYGLDRASEEEQAHPTWIINFPKHMSDEQMEAACMKFVSIGARCDYAGHPSTGGVPIVIVTATKTQLFSVPSLQANSIEVDGITGLIIPVTSEEVTSVGGPSWGLDRINSRAGLDRDQSFISNGEGVTIFSLDTGCSVSHPDFSGRATAAADFTVYNDDSQRNHIDCDPSNKACADDNQGHGTHTAGIAIGKSYGVAPGAKLQAVKVLGDSGTGQWSWVISALDWVAAKVTRENMQRAIVTASLGGPGPIEAVTLAVTGCTEAGISVVVAAGNDGEDACNYLPSRIPVAITVGAIDMSDAKAFFSNTGPCVDIFAPGLNIVSIDNDFGRPVTLSGTSMAAPYVAGGAALLLAEHPDMNPAGLQKYLTDTATRDCIKFLPKDTANKLLYLGPPTQSTACHKPLASHGVDTLAAGAMREKWMPEVPAARWNVTGPELFWQHWLR